MQEIPPFKMILQPLNQEAAKLPTFKWTSEEIGKRHQMGGSPTFLQETTWPICPSCRHKMSFYCQIDSLNDEFCIADCGMIYVFFCFDCNEVKAVVQSF